MFVLHVGEKVGGWSWGKGNVELLNCFIVELFDVKFYKVRII
jgi:hypothetical protein